MAEYLAGGTSEIRLREETDDLPQDALGLSGVLIDSVRTVCEPCPKELLHTDSFTINPSRLEMFAWFNKTANIVSSLKTYPTGEDLKEVYWPTLIANVSYTGSPGTPAPPEYGRYFQAYWAVKRLLIMSKSREQVHGATMEMAQGSERYSSAWAPVGERVLFTTQNGYLGLGPPGLEADDIICIIHGAATPFAIRKSFLGNNGEFGYSLVGECYVHGLMRGEGLDMGTAQDIILV